MSGVGSTRPSQFLVRWCVVSVCCPCSVAIECVKTGRCAHVWTEKEVSEREFGE